jgi:hypothetical protein
METRMKNLIRRSFSLLSLVFFEPNMLGSRYSMASDSDLTHQQPVDSITVDSSGYMAPRQCRNSNTLLMLLLP